MVRPPRALMHDAQLQNLHYQYTAYRREHNARNIQQKRVKFLITEGDIL